MNKSLLIVLLFTSFSVQAQDNGDDMCGGIAGLACGEGQYCNYSYKDLDQILKGEKEGHCGFGDQQGRCDDIPEICTQEWNPVIGCDGKLYGNPCMAAANGQAVKAKHVGPGQDRGASDDGGSDSKPKIVATGKIYANGDIAAKYGNWKLVNITRVNQSIRVRVSFDGNMASALVSGSAFCTYSDNYATAVSYGYAASDVIDFTYETPCGFEPPSGMDFVVYK